MLPAGRARPFRPPGAAHGALSPPRIPADSFKGHLGRCAIRVKGQFFMTTQQTASSDAPAGSGAETLTIVDNRTGRSYELPITDDTIRATDLRQIKVNDSDFGMMTYDPAFMNTASCRSAVTYLDGDAGVLRYRGYPIEQLAEKSSFLEVAYLLVHGELPSQAQLDTWVHDITHHTFVHENVRTFMQGFRYDAHPMGMLESSVGMLSTLYPESKDIADPEVNDLQIIRLIAKMPTLGAFAYRHITGKPFVYPNNELSYSENFLSMLFTTGVPKYEPDPRLVRALDVLFILHADHEQNCSTSAVRSVGSSQVDPYSAVAAGVAALYGPLHGGANEAVLQMLRRIKTVDNILMGFGHRVYKNFDPRATIIKKACDDVFEVTGVNPLLAIAVELEKIALQDEYFVKRKLYPNVDFYSGLIYEALGMPADMFTVLFAIGRTPGWVAQWKEMLGDKEQKISRPRQVYIGAGERDYVEIGSR
jgi:citrate synthase